MKYSTLTTWKRYKDNFHNNLCLHLRRKIRKRVSCLCVKLLVLSKDSRWLLSLFLIIIFESARPLLQFCTVLTLGANEYRGTAYTQEHSALITISSSDNLTINFPQLIMVLPWAIRGEMVEHKRKQLLILNVVMRYLYRQSINMFIRIMFVIETNTVPLTSQGNLHTDAFSYTCFGFLTYKISSNGTIDEFRIRFPVKRNSRVLYTRDNGSIYLFSFNSFPPAADLKWQPCGS